MKKRSKVFTIIGVLVIAISTVLGSQLGAGSSEDPLVTKSYVDKKIQEMMGQNVKQNDNTPYRFEVVALQPGQIILGKQGTEIIVRSGDGIIMESTAGGIQDMTDGVDLKGGDKAPKYHLLITPRDDRRGIMVISSMFVMVRGEYTIQ